MTSAPARSDRPTSQDDRTGEPELTVDQLAAAVGLTVRTVRSYTTRGLLPPPRLRGRTGIYGREHLARLHVLRDMLDAGYTLAAAEQVLALAPAGVTGPGLDVYRALLTPLQAEESEVLDRDVLELRLGIAIDDVRLARLADQGVVRPLPDGRVELAHPSLLRAAVQLGTLGVPMDVVLDTQEVLAEHAQTMAQVCVELFVEHVWQPFEAAGMPEERRADVVEAVERTLPLASQAVLVTFRQALSRAVADVVDTQVALRLAREAAAAASDSPKRSDASG